MPVITYCCPDCGQKVESFAGQQTSDGDTYGSTHCPKCQQVHSVNPVTGQVVGEDELGDPW
jgi:hypothetical protein